jgi:SSS family solute:Na+ symporter
MRHFPGYRQVKPKSSETQLVNVGRISASAALIIGAIIAPLLGSLGQVFQYIQEYTGFISPGVVAIFLFGIFWKRTTANAALIVVLLSIPLSAGLKIVFPEFPFIDRMGLSFLICSFVLVLISVMENQKISESKNDSKFRLGLSISIIAIGLISGIKIMVQDGISNLFGILMVGLAVATITLLFSERRENDEKGMMLDDELFKTSQFFNLSALAICGILGFIYALLW